jgi:MFS family permease
MATTKEKQKLSPAQVGVLIGSMAGYFIIPTQTIPSVVIPDLLRIYPTVDAATMTYFLSITNLATMLAAFLFGILAGRVLPFKLTTIIALVLYVFCGALPMILPDGTPFALLLVTRFGLGLALGCFMPMVQTIIVQTFPSETARAAWLGIGSIFFNLGITLGSSVAGFLQLISWHTVFAFYLIGIIPLIVFIVFFKEQKYEKPVEDENKPKEKVKIPLIAWLLLVTFMLGVMLTGFFPNFGAIFFEGLGMNMAWFGTAMSMMTIGATLIAVAFALVYKVTKTHIITLGCVLITIAYFVLYYFTVAHVDNIIAWYITVFVFGFGMNSLTIGMAMVLSVAVDEKIVTFILGINFLFQNLGSFIATPVSQLWFGVVGAEPVNSILLFAGVFGVILTIYTVIVVVLAGKKGKEREHQKELEA